MGTIPTLLFGNFSSSKLNIIIIIIYNNNYYNTYNINNNNKFKPFSNVSDLLLSLVSLKYNVIIIIYK
jgi:hypothetical protein